MTRNLAATAVVCFCLQTCSGEEPAPAPLAFWTGDIWERFSPTEKPPAGATAQTLNVLACVGEREETGFFMRNVSKGYVAGRIALTRPRPAAYRAFGRTYAYTPMPEIKGKRLPWTRIRLYLVEFTEIPGGKLIPDMLVPMDAHGTFSLMPGQTRLIWLSIDARGLAPGIYEQALTVRTHAGGRPPQRPDHWRQTHKASRKGTPTAWQVLADFPDVAKIIRLRLEVAPVDVSEATSVHWAWTTHNTLQMPEMARDWVEHGLNTLYVTLAHNGMWWSLDEKGKLRPTDLTALDAMFDNLVAAGLPAGKMHVLASLAMGKNSLGRRYGRDSAVRPPRYWSDAWREFTMQWLREVRDHLAGRGISKDRIWWYPQDEPILSRDGDMRDTVGAYIRFAKLIKKADPEFLLFTNPANYAWCDVTQTRRMAPVTDVWCPYISRLNHAEEVAFYHNRTKGYGTSYAILAKGSSPLAHYRGFQWKAYAGGLEGGLGGFWCYDSASGSMWYGLDRDGRGRKTSDYNLIYTDDYTAILASRRWQAYRDGIEDLRLIHVCAKLAKERPELTALLDRLVTETARDATGRRVDEELIVEGNARGKPRILRARETLIRSAAAALADRDAAPAKR